MAWRNIEDYEMARTEITRVQDCITEYMKMYFGVGVLVVGASAFFFSKWNEFHLSENIAGTIFLILNYIVLSFSTIIFHKFNTHNRYAGYVRCLEREIWDGNNLNGLNTPRLWETTLGSLYDHRNMKPVNPGNIDNLKKEIDASDGKYKGLNLWRMIYRVPIGFLMMIRSTLVRYPTKSWTYPYQVAFPLFISTIILFGMWGISMFGAPIIDEIGGVSFRVWKISLFGTPFINDNGGLSDGIVTTFILKLQIIFVVHICLSWCGLSYRLFRLSDKSGDRTISAYCDRFISARFTILEQRGVTASYFGFEPDELREAGN